MLTKYGDFRDDSRSDFDMSKKAEFVDDKGFHVADRENKEQLAKPISVRDIKKDSNNCQQ